jgi:hypothetical protein
MEAEDAARALRGFPVSAVAALAGRRIDAPDAKEARFPLANAERVRERIAAALREHQVAALVASAACGADLIALDEAAKLGARRRIVLPFPVARFREKSVTDRPGDWGALYDRLVRDAEKAGDLVALEAVAGDDDAAYLAATRTIIEQALAASRGDDRVAITVWEGQARSGDDITDVFRRLAAKAGFKPVTVFTV